MKISRIHTNVALMSKDHKFSFDKSQHKLQYFPELNMFKIDDTYVPMSNIREVLVEAEPLVETPKAAVKAAQPKSETIVTAPEVVDNWYAFVPDVDAKVGSLKTRPKKALKR